MKTSVKSGESGQSGRKAHDAGPRIAGAFAASIAAFVLFVGGGSIALSYLMLEETFAVVQARPLSEQMQGVHHPGGTISKVFTAVGKPVAGGELLATVDAGDVDRRIEELKSEARAAQLRLEALRREAQAFDVMQREHLIDRARMTELEKKVADLERETTGFLAQIAEADSRLGLVEIRAPSAGVVHSMSGLAVGREIRTGETVAEIALAPGTVILESALSVREARDAAKGPVRVWRSLASWRDGQFVEGKLVAIVSRQSLEAGFDRPAYIARIEIDAAQASRLSTEAGAPAGGLLVSIPLGQRRAMQQVIEILGPLKRLAELASHRVFSKGA